MRRVLFVDDEPMVLQALALSMRSRRREWEMVFVSSAEQALAQLERRIFDVVVSDMRMPGMDGAELLARIAARWPTTGRLILTGQADSESLARAAPVANFILQKPCEHEELYEAIVDAAH